MSDDKECSCSSRESFQKTLAANQVKDGVSMPSEKIQKKIASVLKSDEPQNEKVPLFNCDIFATKDERLLEYKTSYISCECPGLKYKTDIHICPYTGDRICRHIYRFRLRHRMEQLETQFQRVSRSIYNLYGEKACKEFLNEPPVELVAIKSELAKEPEPKLKKARPKKMTEPRIISIWDELQELKIC